MAPVVFPVFVGGYAWPYPSAPNVIIIYQSGDPENSPARARDEREDPVESGHARYEPPGSTVTPRSGVNKEAIYQIIFKDRSAAPVVAHWVDQDTLHYVTSQGAHRLVPLDSVDRALTEQFNRARKIEFR